MTRGQRPVGEYRLNIRKEDETLVSLVRNIIMFKKKMFMLVFFLSCLFPIFQSFLQGEGHLKNIADTITLETIPTTFDQFDNNVVSTSDPVFIEVRLY